MHDFNEKIELLDRLLTTIDVERLRELVRAEEVVSELKGNSTYTNGILRQILDDHRSLTSRSMQLGADVDRLQSQITQITQILDKTVFSYSQDFYNLKQSLNVY
jgi:hypothetical protein